MSCGQILSALRTERNKLNWWLLQVNTYCESFCPFCKHFDECMESTILEYIDDKDVMKKIGDKITFHIYGLLAKMVSEGTIDEDIVCKLLLDKE